LKFARSWNHKRRGLE